MNSSIIDTLIKHYGPNAFSLVMFLVLWFTAVKPELDKKDITVVEQRQVLSQMSSVAATMERTASTLERIAMLRGEVSDN